MARYIFLKMDLLADFTDFLSTLIASLGAILGILITFRKEREKAKEAEHEQVRAFLGALKVEVDTWWSIYLRDVDSKIRRPDRTGKIEEVLISDSYFEVYAANAGLIGLVGNNALVSQIVKTYAKAHAMLDALRLYSRLIEQALPYSGTHPVMSSGARVSQDRWGKVRQFVATLQTQNEDLGNEVQTLQKHLLAELDPVQFSVLPAKSELIEN